MNTEEPFSKTLTQVCSSGCPSHHITSQRHIKSNRLESISPRLSTQVAESGAMEWASRSGQPIWTWAAFFHQLQNAPIGVRRNAIKIPTRMRRGRLDIGTWESECAPNGCGNRCDRQIQHWLMDYVIFGSEAHQTGSATDLIHVHVQMSLQTNVGRK